MKEIKINGAKVHNLKNFNLKIPKQKLIIITGISGSGKSSLAFDILFEEGKNQYLNSIGILSSLDNEDKFQSIEGIGPTVAVRQNSIRQSNIRSTVGSKTRILNQLALFYASDGKAYDKNNEHLFPSLFLYTTADGMCISCQGKGFYYDINLEALIPDKKTSLLEVYENLKVTSGFLRILKNKYGMYFEAPFWELPKDIQGEVIYGSYENGKQSYCLERILRNSYEKGDDVEEVYKSCVCQECLGERISKEGRRFFIHGKTIGELGQMTLSSLLNFLIEIPKEELSAFGNKVLKDVIKKLEYLIKFRLGHLTLYRDIPSLSGGELQRIYLHLHLESNLDSLIYIFDEPMAGLHPSEKESVIESLKQLRDIGNTVIVVEHDKDILSYGDHIIEIGPKAGIEGGSVVFQGNYEEYKTENTLLSQYFFKKLLIPKRTTRKTLFSKEDSIILEHVNTHYLKDLTVTFPLHVMVGIAGLSGSGKSSLIEETLLKRLISFKKYSHKDNIKGAERISGFVKISQDPIGRNANSTPASYIGIWDKIREIFSKLPEAKVKNMSSGHFSFNSKGACEDCGGSGYEKIFLTSDFSVDKICKTCKGKRFNEESLSIYYKGKNIAEVLDMSITDASVLFAEHKSILKPLNILNQIGMGYLTLGQPSSSLSGGEAQRVKLAKELGRQLKGNILYVLDEPTTGLSLYDTALLLKLLDKLVAGGNSVIVIEHNVEVLKSCDYIIELGPEGGDKGGEIIAEGRPNSLIDNPDSKTGRYLL